MKSQKLKLVRVVTQAEVVLWHLKNFIDRSENDYDLYVIGNDVSRYSSEYPAVTFFDIKIKRKTSPVSDLIALYQLYSLLVRIKPSIIHSIMPKAGFISAIAGRLASIPVRVHTFTGQVWATKTGLSRFILKSMDKLILRLNTTCLTDSPSQSDFLQSNGFFKKNKPVGYLGKGSLSGVSLEIFNPATKEEKSSLRKGIGLNDNDFVYVFLARKSVVKGIIQLFESFNKVSDLPHVKLLFIGPDESNGELEKLYLKYSHLTPQIISYDIVRHHEKFLALSDVLCLPSSSEGFGTIVIEAAAMNVPSIGFDIVGLRDAIDRDQSGMLVPFPNVEKFASAMKYLYDNKDMMEQLKQNGRARVLEYFSADAIYRFQDQFYKKLI